MCIYIYIYIYIYEYLYIFVINIMMNEGRKTTKTVEQRFESFELENNAR